MTVTVTVTIRFVVPDSKCRPRSAAAAPGLSGLSGTGLVQFAAAGSLPTCRPLAACDRALQSAAGPAGAAVRPGAAGGVPASRRRLGFSDSNKLEWGD